MSMYERKLVNTARSSNNNRFTKSIYTYKFMEGSSTVAVSVSAWLECKSRDDDVCCCLVCV